MRVLLGTAAHFCVVGVLSTQPSTQAQQDEIIAGEEDIDRDDLANSFTEMIGPSAVTSFTS